MALIDQMLIAWADTSVMARSLDQRAAGSGYTVEYVSFGDINRSSHLQQNITSGPLTGPITNEDNPLIDETFRDLIKTWNEKIHILEAFNGSYFGCADGYGNEIRRRA